MSDSLPELDPVRRSLLSLDINAMEGKFVSRGEIERAYQAVELEEIERKLSQPSRTGRMISTIVQKFGVSR